MKVVQCDELQWTGVSHDPSVKKQVYIKNGELNNITQMARAVMQPGQISSRHKHLDMNEVFFVESGELVFYMEQAGQTEVQRLVLKAGSCITVHIGDHHEIRNESSEPAGLLYFGVLSATAAEAKLAAQ